REPPRRLAVNIGEQRYWPFEVPPAKEQTESARRQIEFLERAYQAGYEPYLFGSGEDFGATAASRGGIILYRGGQGRHWEVLVGTDEQTILSAHVDDFGCAAEAVLQWLRGNGASVVLELIR